jgi:hypothetical protein
VALTLVADGGVSLVVEGSFVLGEVVQINDNAVHITEFDHPTLATRRRKTERRILGAWGTGSRSLKGKSSRTLCSFSVTWCWLVLTFIARAVAAPSFVMVVFFYVGFVLGFA